MAHLKNVQKELLLSKQIRNPIDNVYGRIKTLESINQKCRKEKYNLDPNDTEGIRREIRDIAGIRITCIYPKDIEAIRNYIDKIRGVFIQEERDYVKHPKESGYQSLHLIAIIEANTQTCGMLKVPVEIQIRTLNMQAWAQVEHRARYKRTILGEKIEPDAEPDAVLLEEKLNQAAKLASELDQLYDEILKASGEQ